MEDGDEKKTNRAEREWERERERYHRDISNLIEWFFLIEISFYHRSILSMQVKYKVTGLSTCGQPNISPLVSPGLALGLDGQQSRRENEIFSLF